MPAQWNTYQSIAPSGSFVMRASLHNRDRFSSARDDLSHPYPSYEDVYFHSNTSNLSGILSKFRSFLPISFILYCANNFIPYLFISLTILDHQWQQETHDIGSTRSTAGFTTATKILHLRVVIIFQTNISATIPEDLSLGAEGVLPSE